MSSIWRTTDVGMDHAPVASVPASFVGRMEGVDGVVAWLSGVFAGFPRAFGLRGWRRGSALMVRAGNGGDSVRDSDVSDGPGHGPYASGPTGNYAAQWTPPYVIGFVAMIGAFIVVFKEGMDTPMMTMLNTIISGLVGMRVGQQIGQNGNGR